MNYITKNLWLFLGGLLVGMGGLYLLTIQEILGITATVLGISVLSFSVYVEFEKESKIRIAIGVFLRVVFILAFIIGILASTNVLPILLL